MSYSNDMKATGGAIKAFSQIAAGNTKEGLEKANEQIAQQQAQSEFQAGAYNANLARMKGRSIMGTQVANIGANNLRQGGTEADVVAGTAKAQEANALQINNNALRRAWGFEVQGSSDQFQAEMAGRQGILSGIGTLASTAGSMYGGTGT
jgi:hypothetical protein